MVRRGLLVPAVVGLSLLAGRAAATDTPEAAITQAALAPFRDVLRHDPLALCGDFVPGVAAKLVPGATPGVGCASAAGREFALTAPNEPRRGVVQSLSPTVQRLEVSGQHASLSLAFSFVTSSEGPGIVKAEIHTAGPFKLQLEEVAGRWLVSSRARLAVVPGCLLAKPRRCRRGSRVLVFSVGELQSGSPTAITIPTPATVLRAGAGEQREFDAGKVVAAQSGCLACHRIGDAGNRGPGPNLTVIGSLLTERRIAHALVDPREPMPSFRHLPARKFHDLVRFLALLR